MNQPSNKKTLKALREEKGLSLTKAAALAAVSYPSLINWENGNAKPNVVSLERLLSLYDATFENLDLSIYQE